VRGRVFSPSARESVSAGEGGERSNETLPLKEKGFCIYAYRWAELLSGGDGIPSPSHYGQCGHQMRISR